MSQGDLELQSSFQSPMKPLGVLQLPLDNMQVHCRSPSLPPPPPQHFVRLSWQLNTTHLYSWMEQRTVTINYPALGHNTIPRPGSLHSKSSLQTVWFMHLPHTIFHTLAKRKVCQERSSTVQNMLTCITFSE